jgi:phosphotransferase system IIA component
MYESSMVEGGMMPVASAPDTHAAAGHGHAVPTPATTHVTAPSTAHVSSTPTTTHMATTTMTPTTMPGDSK